MFPDVMDSFMEESVIEVVAKAGEVLKKNFGKNLTAYKKTGALNFRTKADLESEEIIIKNFQKIFPDCNIFSEERGLINAKSEYTFIIDPLDGTSNFVLGIPNFSISIALVRGDKILYGIVYNPILNQIYKAEKGQGAFLNEKKIKVNNESRINEAMIGYDCDYGHYLENFLRNLIKKLEQKNIKRFLINMSPALDLCRVASGKMECFINNANEIYDYAAGKLIVAEAGGVITDFVGQSESNDRNNKFLASNGYGIHQIILKILRSTGIQ